MKMKKQSKEIKEEQDSQIMYKKVINSEQVCKLRNEFNIPETGFKLNHELEDPLSVIDDWETSLGIEDCEEFEKGIGVLMDDLKIPERFYHIVRDAVLYNEDLDFDRNVGVPHSKIEAYIHTNESTGRKELLLRLDADIKPIDLESVDLWKIIKDLQKLLPDFKTITQRKKSHLKKWEIMYQWQKDGLSYKDIRQKALKELEYMITTNEDVAKILQRYRQTIGINRTRKKEK